MHCRAMLHDPNDYPDPQTFKPERYIKDGKIDPSVRDPTTIAFGFGRRLFFLSLSFFVCTDISLYFTGYAPAVISPRGRSS